MLNPYSWTVTKECKLGNLEKIFKTLFCKLLYVNKENLTKSQAIKILRQMGFSLYLNTNVNF